MSSPTDHLPALAVLQLTERSRVTYYACFAHCLGNDVGAALFASNFLFWEGKQADEEGWIYKDRDEIMRETGMNRKLQEGARKRLRQYGILEEKKEGLPRRLYYRWDWPVLNSLLTQHLKELQQGKEPEPEQEPIMDVMRRTFDEVYEAQTQGVAFNWGSRSERGKHYGNLKKLRDVLAERIASRKLRIAASQNGGMAPAGFNPVASYEEILVSWQSFLDTLPEYFRTKRLNPSLLLSDFSTIVLEVTNGKSSPQLARRTGTDIADAI